MFCKMKLFLPCHSMPSSIFIIRKKCKQEVVVINYSIKENIATQTTSKDTIILYYLSKDLLNVWNLGFLSFLQWKFSFPQSWLTGIYYKLKLRQVLSLLEAWSLRLNHDSMSKVTKGNINIVSTSHNNREIRTLHCRYFYRQL